MGTQLNKDVRRARRNAKKLAKLPENDLGPRHLSESDGFDLVWLNPDEIRLPILLMERSSGDKSGSPVHSV